MSYISPVQLQAVADVLKGKIAGKLAADALVTVLDNTSTDAQVASAKTIYDFITAAISGLGAGLTLSVVETLPPTGDAGTIYLVADDADTYIQHIYSAGQWFDLGGTSPNLSGYWSKTELTVATDAEVQAIIDGLTGV
jgi:hypothetical protein